METVKFSIALERETKTSVWKQSEGIALLTRSVTDIHNDYHNQTERWISGGNNDLYKAHASLSPDRLSMYLYIEIDAAYRSDGFWAALTMILDTRAFGSYISKKVAAYIIANELSSLIEDTPQS